ncbi:MAG: hypothetical protein QUS33_14175 [Dehalococcoidia bacterium]|nr:hypothetical protein [Dehalococcoidia bacterium]
MIVESRLKVIDKLRLDYEVPFVSDRGKVVAHTIVRINERRRGVDISYALLNPTEQDLESLFPRDGMDSLAEMTRNILGDLGVSPKRIALQMWDYGVARGPYSVEGRAPVNRQRDTVLIIFTRSPFVYKFGYEMVLWHQCMHAKDRWERRFPAAHPLVQAAEWMDLFWHFSIDGRLEARNRPHYTKEERLEEAADLFRRLRLPADAAERAIGACSALWGREVTLEALLETGRNLGLETRETAPPSKKSRTPEPR